MKTRAILTDIEGTTSSIAFVHNTLFPYAAQALPRYVKEYAIEPEVASIIAEVNREIAHPDASLDEAIETLLAWIKEDRKITPLKTLQGFIWEYGYKNGEFQSHVYEDACRQLKSWHEGGIDLYVYSSGSENAQKLLFAHSIFGDLTYLFKGYFDTRIGGKKESISYQKIAAEIKVAPAEILFLSDVVAEIEAATEAGYDTILVARDGVIQEGDRYKIVSSFDEIVI